MTQQQVKGTLGKFTSGYCSWANVEVMEGRLSKERANQVVSAIINTIKNLEDLFEIADNHVEENRV